MRHATLVMEVLSIVCPCVDVRGGEVLVLFSMEVVSYGHLKYHSENSTRTVYVIALYLRICPLHSFFP